MKINIKSDYCKFVVNEEKRKVTCVISGTENLLCAFLNEPKNFEWTIPNAVKERLKMPKSFSGIATCSEADEWNEEIGKKIAFNRAKHKVDKSFFKKANYLISTIDVHLNELLDKFNVYGEKLAINLDKRNREIKEYVGTDVSYKGK